MRRSVRFWWVGSLAAIGMLIGARSAEAGLMVAVEVAGVTKDVTSLLSSAGTNTYGVGGASNEYLVFNVNGTYVGTSATAPTSKTEVGVRLTLTDNAPGTAAAAELFNVTNDVRTNGGGSPLNVVITAAENGFTLPTGWDQLSGTFSSSGGDGDTSTSFTSTVLQGSNTLATVNGTGSSSVYQVSGTYTIENVTTITDLNANITGGHAVSTSGNSTVTDPPPPVPEPASIAITLIGAGLAAAAAWRRKRRGQR